MKKYFLIFLKLFCVLLIAGCAAQKEEAGEEAKANPDEARIISVSPTEVVAGRASLITIEFTCRLLSQSRGVIGMGFNGADVEKSLALSRLRTQGATVNGVYEAQTRRIAGVKKVSRRVHSAGGGQATSESFKRVDRGRYIMSDSKIEVSRSAPEDGESKITNSSQGESGLCSGAVISVSEWVAPVYDHSSDNNEFQFVVTLSDPDHGPRWTPLAYDIANITVTKPGGD